VEHNQESILESVARGIEAERREQYRHMTAEEHRDVCGAYQAEIAQARIDAEARYAPLVEAAKDALGYVHVPRILEPLEAALANLEAI